MKRFGTIFCLLLVATLFVTLHSCCKKAEPTPKKQPDSKMELLGTWRLSKTNAIDDFEELGYAYYYQFRANGVGFYIVVVPDLSSPDGKKETVTRITYRHQGSKLIVYGGEYEITTLTKEQMVLAYSFAGSSGSMEYVRVPDSEVASYLAGQ